MNLPKHKHARTAVILCGGKGTRLGSITKKIPKSMVKINEKPIIWYILKTLKYNNFNHFILPVGYKGDQIKKYIATKDFNDFNVKIVSTGVNTPIAKRIFKIKKFINSDNFLLLNGDAIFDFNLDKIFRKHIKNNKSSVTFLGSETNLPYGTIVLSNGLVKNFQRDVIFNAVKIANKSNNTAYVYSGMVILNNKILNENFQFLKNFEIELYPKIIKNYKCKFQKLFGFWHSIDNIKDIKTLKHDINKKIIIKNLIKKLK